ncbi:hypothetical protein HY492_01455 [Candidatus Woesearchaeota archaeon]|nr:hypothetical protein [Candidatus Woesearchaeota archaeon]
MKQHLILAMLTILLIGCTERPETVAETPTKETTSTPEETVPPALPPRTPVTPPAGGTTSSEPISGTSDCTVTEDCITYEDNGMPVEQCARYDEIGCYHSYACAPSGEAVQKETPAFCGR